MTEVVIYTDGACSGNPGPGGWGVVLQWNGTVKELHGGEPQTTNNRMELTAAIQATKSLVDGYWLNIPGQGPRCPTCNPPRPDVGIAAMRAVL